MSTGSSYANQSAASRPILTLGAQRNFNTWSSIDQELASHRASPHAVRPRSLRVVLRKKAHALFSAVRAAFESLQLPQPLLDVLAIAVAVVFGLSCSVAVTWALFILFFVKT